MSITLFISITMLCGIDNIVYNIPHIPIHIYFKCDECSSQNYCRFHIIMLWRWIMLWCRGEVGWLGIKSNPFKTDVPHIYHTWNFQNYTGYPSQMSLWTEKNRGSQGRRWDYCLLWQAQWKKDFIQSAVNWVISDRIYGTTLFLSRPEPNPE